VIYWLVSNVWAIGQQYLTNYMIGPPRARAARPPGERRVKKVTHEQQRGFRIAVTSFVTEVVGRWTSTSR